MIEILNTQLFACLFMTGVIWIVQLVHYPSFRFIKPKDFYKFNKFHQSSISFVVMPAMLVELVACLLFLGMSSEKLIPSLLFVLLVLIWLSTFLISVPLHDQLLSRGFNPSVINRLIITNWPRTILWSLRSILLIQLTIL